MMSHTFCRILFFTLLFGWSIDGVVAQISTQNYTPSTEDFANPERGFYRYSETRSSPYSILDQSLMISYRSLHKPNGETSSEIYSTLVFRYFFLEDFKDASISQSYLDNMQLDFDVARAAGVKLIPRFAYTDNVNTGDCGSWICPPYGDASKSQVLEHIEQVGPILKKNRDVIAAIQMGWIGVWGEQYYTDYFGDASQSPFILTDTNWADRIEVLEAFLDATPTDRMIQARYPQMKQRAIYGISAPTSSAALIQAEAYQGDYKSRIGFHNDCYLASADDFGTFTDYGNSSSPSLSDTLNLKPYKTDDSKFVVVGGETCGPNNPDDNCSSAGGRADTEMRRLHYSYLNADYNYPDVNSDWEGVCMDSIKRYLGYRFHLSSASISSTAQASDSVDVSLEIINLGYAAPYNERLVELVLRNVTTDQKLFVTLDSDPRYWFSDEPIMISQSICLPDDIAVGDYEILLNLPDPQASLIDRSEYSIRLASKIGSTEVWEPSTGYNDLGLDLEIESGTASSICNQASSFDYCHSSLKIAQASLASYQAAVSIESDATLENTTSFTFGQWMSLQPGFAVPIGLAFDAIVDNCIGQ